MDQCYSASVEIDGLFREIESNIYWGCYEVQLRMFAKGFSRSITGDNKNVLSQETQTQGKPFVDKYFKIIIKIKNSKEQTAEHELIIKGMQI